MEELKPNTPQKRKKRVGRGVTRGKTSGRGHKGQKARAGRNIRPQSRDMIKRIPKKRGYQFNPVSTKPIAVNVATLDTMFSDGEQVTPEALIEKGVIQKKSNEPFAVKILGTGTIATKLRVSGCRVSDAAREKIENAGGTVS